MDDAAVTTSDPVGLPLPQPPPASRPATVPTSASSASSLPDHPGAASRWRALQRAVAPKGIRAGLDAAARLAAVSTLMKSVQKVPRERDAADLRCGGASVSLGCSAQLSNFTCVHHTSFKLALARPCHWTVLR